MAKLLLVDEDERVLRLMAWVLEADGHETVSVQSAEQAMWTAKSRRPDLVLFDVSLPRALRARVIEDLRRVTPTVHVIDVATYREAKGRLVRGADRGLLQPFDADELVPIVHDLTTDS